MGRRLAWAHYMQALGHTDAWFFKALVWCDLCNSILPRTEQKAKELTLAREAGKGWMSDGSQGDAVILRGRVTATASTRPSFRVLSLRLQASGSPA